MPTPTIHTPTLDTAPPLGYPLIHPALETSTFQDLLHPDRPLWTPRELRDLTRQTAADFPAPLHTLLRYDENQRWWLRLALTAGVELWLLSWTPGQRTAPHDHNGAAGAFSVLTGTLYEEYTYPNSPIRASEYHPGAGIGFGAGRAHQVHNTGSVNAASVHAYSPPLRDTRQYPSLADVPALEAVG